jgi:hypothetical protein
VIAIAVVVLCCIAAVVVVPVGDVVVVGGDSGGDGSCECIKTDGVGVGLYYQSFT